MGDRSIAAVLSDIVGDIQYIVRAEFRLAKIEVRDEFGRIKRGLTWLAIGGFGLVMAIAFIELAGVWLLASVWPAWLAALTVAFVNGLGGFVLVAIGMRRLRAIRLMPPLAAASVQENIQWAKTRIK